MRKHNVRFDVRGIQIILMVILMCLATGLGTVLRLAVTL